MTDIETDLIIANAEIKRLQSQLAEYDALAAEYGIDGKTMLTLAKSQIRTAQDNIKLQEQLAASQRRADAAVECIEKIDDWNNHFCYHDLEEIIDEWRGVKEEME